MDVSGSVDTHHQVLCGSAPSLPLDRCVLSRLGSCAGAVAGGLRKWTTAKCHFHVNVLEMRAVLCVVTFFRLHDLSLCVFTDNETVRYTLALCRTRSLTLRHEMIALLAELQIQNLWFQVLRISMTLNVVADALSCEDPLNTEWTLPQPVFVVVYRWAGLLDVDLMASPVNHCLPRCVSFPHPDALAVDCQSIDWNAFVSLYLISFVNHDPPASPAHPVLPHSTSGHCALVPSQTMVPFFSNGWSPISTCSPFRSRGWAQGSCGTRRAPPHVGPLCVFAPSPQQPIPRSSD